MLGEKLQRHLAVELRVLRLVHHTHPALAEPLDDAVMANRGADNQDAAIVALRELRKGRQR